MQSFGAEIVIPFKYKPRIRRNLKSLRAAFLFSIALFFCFFTECSAMAANMGLSPDLRDQVHTMMVFGAILFVLFLLFYGVLFTFLIRKLYGPSQDLYISHVGILLSSTSILIKWDEIVTLFPYTIDSRKPSLGIILQDYDAFLSRTIEHHSRKAWQRGFYHFLVKVNARVSHHLNARAPVNILQELLCISIDDLLAMIQEQFATELQEHHITVLQWQS